MALESPLRIVLSRLVQMRHEISWIVVGQILVFLGGFAGIKILTNIMGPEGYGQLALGLTIAGILNMFVYGPIAAVVMRFFSVYREKNKLTVYFYILKRVYIVSGLLLLAFMGTATILTKIYVGNEWALLVIMASLFGVVSGVNGFFLSLQSAIRQRKLVALHQGMDAWLRLGLAVVAIYLFRNSGYSALQGYFLGTLLITISQWVFALRNADIHGHWSGSTPEKNAIVDSTREFYTYASPFVLWAGIAAFSMYADRWILQGLFGEREVGIYVALYQIANAPISLAAGLISQLMVPIIFERAGAMVTNAQAENSRRLLYRTIAIYSIVMLPTIIIAYFFSEPLVRLFTTYAFAKYHKILWVIILGLVFFQIGQSFSIIGHVYKQTKKYIVSFLVSAIAIVLLSYFLGKLYGIEGVAWALCISNFLYMLVVLRTNKNVIKT